MEPSIWLGDVIEWIPTVLAWVLYKCGGHLFGGGWKPWP